MNLRTFALTVRSYFLIQAIGILSPIISLLLHHFGNTTPPSIRIAYKLQLIQVNPRRFMSFAKVRQGWPRFQFWINFFGTLLARTYIQQRAVDMPSLLAKMRSGAVSINSHIPVR